VQSSPAAPQPTPQLPALAETSTQHGINCRCAGRKGSLIKHISKGTVASMSLSANFSCGDPERCEGTGRRNGNAGRQERGSKGTPQAAPWVQAGRGRGPQPLPQLLRAPAAPPHPCPHRVRTEVRQPGHRLGSRTPPRWNPRSCSGWKQQPRGRGVFGGESRPCPACPACPALPALPAAPPAQPLLPQQEPTRPQRAPSTGRRLLSFWLRSMTALSIFLQVRAPTGSKPPSAPRDPLRTPWLKLLWAPLWPAALMGGGLLCA